MKKPTTLKLVLAVLLFIQSFVVFSQKNFTPRFDTSLKGDMLLIGNNILNRDVRNNERPNDAFNSTSQNNNDLDMQYIDVDNDASTFSSSSANLAVPQSSRECYKIVYAGLYWAGIYSKGAVDNGTVNRSNLGSVKIKLANQSTYTDIQGSLIYDYYPSTSNGDQMPYAYYYDLTTLVQGLANPEGTYTVANIISGRGRINGGFSAGWNLFVVYEDPKSSAKYITSFDGFRWIQASSGPVTYDIAGFKTIPTGTVKAKLAFAALEGDVNLTGDKYSINNTDISTAERAVNNFFNSTINDTNGPYTSRNPASGNTLGFEAGILNVPNPATTANPGGSVIKNNDTSAQLKLTTSGDGYGLFFNAFNVEIIEPKIVLTKIVKNAAGDNIGGQNVTLGQVLNYEIGFKNTGNDNATSFTIRDQLPINIIFNRNTDINPLPAGVTVQSYDATTRNIVFRVANNVVKVGDPEKIISFKVQVVPDCKMLSEACSNSIDNSAYATYKGTQNTSFTISDDPSVNTNTGCILVPKATNFLVGVDGCKYTENVTLCGESINLTAANGYTNYTWYSDEAQTNQIGTGQTLTVRNPGTYYVYNLAAAPCRSIYQSFVVTRFGSTVENPIIPFASQVVTCSNDGKKLPNIFLCGGNASKQISLNISDASSIVWERLNEASCTAVTNQNCANESTSCTWTRVATGRNYNANTAGQFRLTLNYAGGCFNRFYFNVYTNSLTPTETHKDIICGAPGSITIGGVPAGYEYAISTDPNGTLSAYQSSNIFPITSPNSYTVHIRQVGVATNPCIFTVPGILIRNRDLQISTAVTQPTCVSDKGSIKVGAQNIDPQYYYYIYNSGGTLVNSFGPTADSDYTFANLSSGTYSVRVTNGALGSNPAPTCDKSVNVTVNAVPAGITATPALTAPLTSCSNGKITVTSSGGTAPYYHFINGSTSFQLSNEIDVPTPGKYDIRVVDANNCSTTTSITVTANPKPVYTPTASEINCNGGTSTITVNVTNANGYTLQYSIDNGATFVSNPSFPNIAPGTYNVVVRYTLSGVTCTDPATAITITAPANAVSASAGVSELAGCDPSGNGFGKVRITNPQGGTAPYTYSFDGGTTFITANEAYVAPGTYTLYVRDSKGCTFSMPGVILDPKPADPTISVGTPVYNCNGTATSTVTVTNSGSANYSYEYYLDNVLNPNTADPRVFLNVPSGPHTVSVKYNLISVPTYSNLLQEDFGSGGTTTTPGIASAYCFNDQRVNAPYQCGTRSVEDNQYSVTSFFWRNDTAWYHFKDHTTNGVDPNGRYLLVNIGSAAGPYGILYSKPIVDVIPNQPVMVDLYVANLLNVGAGGVPPIVRFELVNSAGVVVAQQDTGKIAEDPNDPNRTKWVPINISLNPGPNTNLTFRIRSGSTEYGGNDLVIDDIWVRQIPKSCISQKDFPIVIDSNKAFTAAVTGSKDLTCNGVNTGEITISAQNFNLPYGFDYSLDNGTTWVNSKTSPVTATGLGSGNYNIRVRFDASATSCVVPLTHEVKTPAALSVSADVTVQPTCTTGASITATALGGTPAYQYELRQSNGTTVVVAFQSSRVFANVSSGSYVVVARDGNSCASPASVRVDINAPTPPAATLAASSDLCYDTVNRSTLVVDVTGGKIPYSYSLDGAPGQTSNTFNNVGPGTHSIVVTDANGCTAPAISNIVIANELKAEGNITKQLDCITNNAEITVTVTSGGTAPFTYAVAVNGSTTFTTIPSNVYTANAAGSYVFRVTDSKGCIVVTTAVVVDPITNPTATANSVNPSCNNGTDGQFTVIPAGGGGAPYTYSFNGSTTFGTSPTLTVLNAFVGSVNTRDYTYQVKDNKGCVSPVYTVTLSNPTPVVASAVIAPNTTCNPTTVITVTGAGGSNSYSYSFNGSTSYGPANTLTVNNTSSAQTITYSVKDTKGCIDTKTINVPAYNPPTALSFSTPAAITCNTTATSLTVTAVGGVAPFTYEVTSGPTSPASNTTGNFTGLVPGTYNFRVTDANGCTATGSRTIDAAPAITVSGSKTDEVCFGSNNGTATFNIGNPSSSGNFTYTLTPNAGTVTKTGNSVSVTGLTAGSYSLVVRDITTGCTSNTYSVTVGAASQITYTVTATKINCKTTKATLTFTGLTGGTPGYSYAYAASPSTVPSTAYGTAVEVDTAVLTSSIDVYVKDNKNCVVKTTIAIASEDVPTIDTPASQCYTGTPINITITGTYVGTPSFSKDGIFYQPSPNFSLTPGTYALHLRDGFGCDVQTTYVVSPQLTITPTIVPDVTCTPNTVISLASSGGTGTRSYQVSFNGGTYTATTSPYTATATGTYKFRVSDSANPVCYAETADIPVTLKPTTLTITTSKVDVLCHGGNTGSILVTPTSGKAPYTYSITRSGTPATNYTVNNPSGLIEGTYNIVVTDALGCTNATASVTIIEPTQLDTNATATSFRCDTNNAKQSAVVTITVPTTGTSPYTYSFNGGSFAASNTLTIVDNGNNQAITYAVKDANGCIMPTKTITVNRLNPPAIASVVASPIYCAPASSTTSSATVTVTTGTGIAPFVYEIVSGPTSAPSNGTGSFIGLASGNYVFKVTDNSGCYDTFPINIAPAVPLLASATKLNDVYCFGDSTGVIRYNVSGFASTYSYSVNSGTPVTGQTAAVFTIPNLGPGTYSVVFTDETTGCTAPTTAIIISQPTAVLSATAAYVNANCNIPTAKVTITAAGGTPAYRYSFSNSNTVPGTYDTSNSASLNPALTWYAWVKDANECTFVLPLTLTTDTTPSVTASVTNQCSASGSSFTIVAVGSNGVAPYTYTINTGQSPSPANTFTVGAGTYTITVRDVNNCTSTTTVTVNDAMDGKATLTKDLTCAAPTDATIEVSVTGGAAPFGYKYKVGAGAYTGDASGDPIPFTGTSFVYTATASGVYQFEITDANGCTIQTTTANVTDYVPVSVTVAKVDPTCNGSSDGTIRFTNPVGEAPFRYSIDNGVTFGNLTTYGGLLAGTYDYVVIDSKGCTFPGSITLNNPAPIAMNLVAHEITCNSTVPGSIDASVASGGTAPYVYRLYNNSMTQIATYTANTAADAAIPHNFPGLMFGDYYVNVVDANGCEFKSGKLRIQPPPYLDLTSNIAGATCIDGVDVTVNVTGGNPNFTYTIYGIGTTSGPISATSYTFTGLDQNTTYVFEVLDSGGCPSYLEVTTPKISNLEIDPITATNVTCNGSANGRIDFTVSDYNGTSLDFEVRDNLTNTAVVPPVSGSATGLTGADYVGSLTGLRPGNYTLYVRESDLTSTRCSTTKQFQITEPAQPLDASIIANVNANCDDPAQVTVRVTGGTGPYTFAYAVSPATPTAFASGNVLSLDPGPTGTDLNWNIIVRDAQNCTFPLTATIVKDPSPVISLAVANNCAAQGAFGIVVSETTAGTGAYSIKVDSGVFQSIPGLPFTVTNLSSGNHTITIKDANDCADTKSININAPLKLEPAITTPPSCVVNDGVVTLTPSGGTNSYSYSITPTHASISITGNTISGLRADTYTITMTDNGNLCTTTAEVTLQAGTPVTFDATVTNVSCFNGTNGKIVVNLFPSNNNPTYTYAISPTPLGYVQNNNEFSNLPFGTYDITVTSGRGCSLTLPFTVTQPALLGATASVAPYICNASNVAQPAVVTVTPSGGTGPYRYNFDGGTTYYSDATTQVTVSTSAQTVNYYVIDANGCTFDSSTIVPAYQPLTDITFALTTAPVCPTNVSDVTLTVTGGYTPYAKYEIISPITQDNGNNAVFTGLAPNTYLFKVTDANGCSIERPYKVEPVVPIDIVPTSSVNVSCNTVNGTDNNGSATFTVSDFSASGNYNIVVTTNPTGLSYNPPTQTSDVITLTGLEEGTYTVTVTDITTLCPKSADVTITMPAPILFAATASKVFCSEDNSTITVTNVTGGTSPYSYAVVANSQPAPTTFTDASTPLVVDTNLTDLSWDVYVQDANGCVSLAVTVPVTYDVAPNLNMPAQQCFVGANLIVDLDALSTTYNGVKSFTVNGLPSTATATFTAAGMYKINLTDDNGCTDEVDYIVQPQLIASASVTKDLYCAAPINATIDVEISGGVGTYTYQMYYNGAATGLPSTTPGNFTASVAADGDYYFVITDSNSPTCSVTTNTVTVNPTVIPTLTDSHINVSCNTFNDGSLTVVATGGRLPYTFVLSGPITNNTGDATGTYTGLIAGTYTVIATDSKNCASAVATIVITEPDELRATHAITVNSTCSTSTEVVVTAQDGTSPYQYNFNGQGYDTEANFVVVNDGSIASVTYTVKDANGCETAPVTIPIVPLNKPTDLAFSATNITCATGNSSDVTVTATNGVGALTFEIIEFNGAPTTAYAPVNTADNTVAATFTGLPFGDYTFRVTDSNGCTYSELFTVKDVIRVNATASATAMTCYATTDGTATFNVSGFAGTYTYTITKDGAAFTPSTTTSDASIALTNLDFGVYEISIVDDITSCPVTATATVVRPTLVQVAEISNVNANCKTGAIVEVLGSGGNPGYTYSFVPAGQPAGTFDALAIRELDPATAAWFVYAKDINECVSAPITVNIVTDPLPAGFTAAAVSQCPDATTGTYDITITPGTGMGPFEYSIGAGFQAGLTFTVSVPKTYDLIVRDRFGCEFTFAAAVTILQPLDLQNTLIDLPTCADGDGSVSATATGGSGNYSYTIDGTTTVTTTPAPFGGLTAGSHTIVVTDLTTNCTDDVTFILGAATQVTGFAATATDVTCFGGNDGTITATLDAPAPGINDNPVYMYSINGGPAQDTPVFTGLTQGSYLVRVVSGRGCEATETVIVGEPAIITVPDPLVAQYLCAANNNNSFATITISNVTGGSGVYPNYEFIRNGVVVYKGSNNVYTENDYQGGTYTVNVYDENGCIGTNAGTYVINPFISLDDTTVTVTNAITCTNNEDITVTVATTGGTPANLEYAITDASGNAVAGNPNNNTGIFTNLSIGNYLISVTNLDTNCVITDVHYVNDPNTFEIKAEPTNAQICYGTADGTVNLTFVDRQPTPSDEAGAFDYTITGPVSSTGTTTGATTTLSNLTAGQYTVSATLVGSPYCTVQTVFTIEQPSTQLSVTTTQSEITCNPGNNDGEITAAAAGGWDTNYQYQLVLNGATVVDYSAQFSFTGLSAGTYTINVKDGKDCIATTTATLVIPTPITVTATANVTTLACFGDKTAVITVNPPTGGQGSNYLYTLNVLSANPVIVSGPQADPVFTDLGAGTYSITVTDGFNCTATSTNIVITEPTEVVADLILASSQTCNTQSTLTLSAVGGNGPYTYSTDPAFATTIGSFTSSVTFPVAVGTYQYYVRDTNNCTSFVSNEIKIDPLTPLTVDLDITNAVVKCMGEATGVIVAEANGGLGNYIYTLEDTAGNTLQGPQNNGRFENLLVGTYRVKVDSGDCTSTSATATITEPATALQATFTPTNVSCFGENNGRIVVAASGGTGVIKYAISPDLNQFDFISTFERLAPGTYTVIAQDENGCYVLTDVEITQPTPVIVTEVPNSMIPEVCAGDKDGRFSIEITGGTAPYSVSLDNANGTFIPGTATQTVFDFINLNGGLHTVHVRDAQGCPQEIVINMPLPVTLNPTAEVTYDCVNNSQANMVVVKIDASNNPTDVDYSLDNNGTYQPSNIFTNVPAGDHFIVARHTNGCEVPTPIFTIDAVAELSLIDVTNQSKDINTIVVQASGGFAPYEYSFNGESFTSSNSYRIYKTGDYTVIVRDKNGCEATIVVHGTFYDFCLPNYFTPNGDGQNDSIGPDCGALAYKELTFDVYDRYGRVVGKYRVGGKWDGRYHGNELPTGDYWYVLKLNDPKDPREFVGHFTLYR